MRSKAYRRAWIHFFELCNLGHFHPLANEWLKKIHQTLTSPEAKAKRGRRATSKAENESLKRRYEALLPNCRLIHEAVQGAAASIGRGRGKIAPGKIRRATWERIRSSVHGMPGDNLIFGNAAFEKIPYQNEKSQLHDPTTWKPHQLAIALLSFERKQAYQTIEKKIRPTGKTKHAIKSHPQRTKE